MALCTSCGSDVDDAAGFCTSCGQRMPSTGAGATITVTRPACSACGAQVAPGSVFCTNCGQRMAQPALIEEPAPGPIQAEAEPVMATAIAPPLAVEAAPMPAAPSASSLGAICKSCGARLEPGTGFCTTCGQPASGIEAVTSAPATSVVPAAQSPRATESAEPAKVPLAAETATVPPPGTLPEDAVTQPAPPTATQIAPPIYATPTNYSSRQPGGGAFRMVMLILLLLIVVGVFGGWYFWGVETVIVCSPPDVRVFLDDKELAPESYGRYVIPHLSRQAHLLKVQRAGFADTLQRLDFPLASTREWVNIRLVPSRQLHPSSPR